MKPLVRIFCHALRALVGAALVFLASFTAKAATAETGTIEGRVFNGATGAALENARVSLDESRREAATDQTGTFRIVGVPVGEVRLSISYLGFKGQSATVAVTAGTVTTRDFDLALATGGARVTLPGDPVVLQEFTVTADREMSAQAVAMNEQRNAPNIRNVVAIDEYGDRGYETIGEFMRFLPGVALTDAGPVPNEVTLRGFPANNSEVMIDGGQLAGARSGNTRALSLLEVPTANVSRVEITKVPTPDMPASGLGGTINLITKSGFETRRPVFSYQAYMLFNTRDRDALRGEPVGQVSGTSPEYKQPSFNFSYLRPVNPNFALTVGGSRTWRQKPRDAVDETPTWDLVNLVQRSSQWLDQAQVLTTLSGNVGADWRVTRLDTVGASLSYRETSSFITRPTLSVNYGTGATGGPTFTQGATTGVGTFSMNTVNSNKINTASTLLNLKYSHKAELWRFDATASRSRATNQIVDVDGGFFNTTPAQISNVTIRGDGVGEGGALQATRYTALTRTGAMVDPYDGGNYSLTSGTSGQNDFVTVRSTARLDLTRDFVGALPFTLKAGAGVDRLDKDMRTFGRTWNFRPNGASDATSRLAGKFDLFDDAYDAQAPTVYGVRARWISLRKTYALYAQHPDWFVEDQATTYQGAATGSRRLIETVSSAYLRGDIRLFKNRLWLIGGVRFEKTTDDGRGALNDPAAQYQKDARGNVVLDGNGRPIFLTDDPLARAKLRYVERGAHARRTYDDFYPSLNASFNVTENLIVRAAYARTIGRPNVNFITPGATLSDPTVAQPTITVNNTGLKPWTADNFDFSVESYHIKDGFGSLGVFQKNLTNFFGAFTARATPELLELYGLPTDPLYLNYDITTQTNAGDAKITGMEFTYRQSLTFLPHWARGFQVFLNTTRMHLTGSATSDFAGFSPSNLSAGINFIRSRYYIKLTCTYQGETKLALQAVSASIPPDTYSYQDPRLRIGLSAQYSFSKRYAVYGSITDLGGGFSPATFVYGPNTPEYAKYRRFSEYGSYITVGITGQF